MKNRCFVIVKVLHLFAQREFQRLLSLTVDFPRLIDGTCFGHTHFIEAVECAKGVRDEKRHEPILHTTLAYDRYNTALN